MKSLKFDHELAQLILQGKKSSTWRVEDDKDISLDDVVNIIDKVNPKHAPSWVVIGTAKVTGVTVKHLGDINHTDLASHESYESQEAMLKAFQKYYGSHVNTETPVKIIDFEFHPGYIQSPDDAANIDTLALDRVKMYADGGSRGNPGPSASGFVVLDMADKILARDGSYLGKTTNNQAEYHALKLGLEKALELNAKSIDVYMDSQLVINQMKGIYKVKNRELLPVHLAIKDIAERFDHITYTHVPRELNKLADGMVNEILDATDI